MLGNPHTDAAPPSAAQQFTSGTEKFLESMYNAAEGGVTEIENALGAISKDVHSFQGMLSDYGLAQSPEGWTGTSKYPKTKRIIGKFVATPFGRQTLRRILDAILKKGPSTPKEPKPSNDNGSTAVSETDRALRGNKRSRKRKRKGR